MPVTLITIDQQHAGQRIDNYLISACKGVPKTRLYRALRKGEVRVNQKRVKPEYRLADGDIVRIPPLRVATREERERPAAALLLQIEQSILLETDQYMVVDKPAGIPVHGGTGIHTGLIEGLRELRPNCKFLELAHRLDRETSGCLIIAKRRSTLLKVHDLLLKKKVNKRYWALVEGRWPKDVTQVNAQLYKNHRKSGERVVIVSDEGKPSETLFKPVKYFSDATLVEAMPVTGRTHQIRVHAAHAGHPIAGDEKYGNREFNKRMKSKGLKRLFLHSISLYCRLQEDPEAFIGICAPLDRSLARFCSLLN